MAAATDDWLERSRELPSQPREPDDDQAADPDPPDADGYEPI